MNQTVGNHKANHMQSGANRKSLMLLSSIGAAMLCLGFASKPLYDTFCRVTGYGGTTQVADARSDQILDRDILVRFDSNVSPSLNWEFLPKERSVSVKVGQNVLAFYTARNLSNEPIVGTASYNVSPIKAAPYFSKIQCFCFTEQRLEPGEDVVMPVLFFVDPLMAESERHNDVEVITLSYTFHKVDSPQGDALTSVDRAAILDAMQTPDGLDAMELVR